jgi:hypothetical protein
MPETPRSRARSQPPTSRTARERGAAPEAAEALIQLIDLGRECCAWIDFDVSEGSVATLTAEGNGEAVLAGMFQGQ